VEPISSLWAERVGAAVRTAPQCAVSAHSPTDVPPEGKSTPFHGFFDSQASTAAVAPRVGALPGRAMAAPTRLFGNTGGPTVDNNAVGS
jgi:hypothetical protein